MTADRKKMAITLLSYAAAWCEGIQELKDAGVDVIAIQNAIENAKLTSQEPAEYFQTVLDALPVIRQDLQD